MTLLPERSVQNQSTMEHAIFYDSFPEYPRRRKEAKSGTKISIAAGWAKKRIYKSTSPSNISYKKVPRAHQSTSLLYPLP